MAYIDCPECRLEISNRAAACPRCGFPMKQKPAVRFVDGLSPLDAAKSIVARVILGGALLASGAAWEAPPVIICSMVVIGSTIPVWLKARKAERLRSSGEIEAIEPPTDRRLVEAEARGRDQVAELDVATHQVEDLQERLEFLERLVAKRQQGVD